MKVWRTILIFAISFLITIPLAYKLPLIQVPVELINLILSVSGILFGLFVGFFISELWSRHTAIRELMSEHGARFLNLISYVNLLSDNKSFKKDIKAKIEQYAIACLASPIKRQFNLYKYFLNIFPAFEKIQVRNEKDNIFLNRILDNLDDVSALEQKINVLGKEHLFLSEWVLLLSLSVTIISTVFLQRTGDLFSTTVAAIFPPIVLLALMILYDLDSLKWNEYTILFEPDERILDALGVKRFYDSKDVIRGVIPKHILDRYPYRTEKDLKGKLKEIYSEF